ncbi:methyltransferase type 12 [endosymbiont 'TC1' of Trimyema compressum]|uniref:class I SAM-dependent methyltransferase n=1 Tax=endosymbiont 'TC1' of Trimyema compressum TaxID=243899 RepID=UPI0007F0A58A|nr:class I SAM-dependent methyltransferase [endosymbiont 'TC1' of Trimyema compressum]AMP19806.1 methyltransferase type 12 [endosymbiont 'TC1' of Trimyema compressum]
MNDNKTAYIPTTYDKQVMKTIPYYNLFHETTIDLVTNANIKVHSWLDIGCGTGTFIKKAKEIFVETQFVLADPSIKMLDLARSKINSKSKITLIVSDSQNLDYKDESFDVITAIQSHHYMSKTERVKAINNCYRMLKNNGILIVFENIMPLSNDGVKIGLKRWGNYQLRNGKAINEINQHIDRFGKEYFPISIIEHINLLNKVGFRSVEILWTSYMQALFYAIK